MSVVWPVCLLVGVRVQRVELEVEAGCRLLTVGGGVYQWLLVTSPVPGPDATD